MGFNSGFKGLKQKDVSSFVTSVTQPMYV